MSGGIGIPAAGRAAWLLALGLAVGGTGETRAADAGALETLEDHFTRDWYYTEVVVFQRPAVQDYALEEELTRDAAPLPRTSRSFELPPEQRWQTDRLTPFARAHLTFPYLDLMQLPPALAAAQLTGQAEAFDSDTPADAPPSTGAGSTEWARQEVVGDAAGAPPPATHPRLEPDPLLDFLEELARFEASLAAESFQWLEPDTFALTGAAQRLAQRGGFQILLHGRWLQPVPPRDAPVPLYFQSGPRHREVHALEGTFEVTLGRYLHFRTNLYYTEPLLGRSPVDQALPPATPAPGIGVSVAGASSITPELLEPAGFMQLRESRRLRSGELHYLDHPKLGVLVTIVPVTPPERLSAAFLALEETEQ